MSDAHFIVTFPAFSKEDALQVDALRLAHNPLHHQIAAHVTLVFPQSRYDAHSLEGLVKDTFAGTSATDVTFDRLEVIHEEATSYLFLLPDNPKTLGGWQAGLYNYQLLRETTSEGNLGKMHMTVGRFPDRESANAAYVSFHSFRPIQARFDTIAVVSRQAGQRVIHGTYPLI